MALLIARQRTIHTLRVDNRSLRNQVDARRSACQAPVSESQGLPAARLSEADERELLQLRSRIGFLREQLRDISNRVTILQRLSTNQSRTGERQ